MAYQEPKPRSIRLDDDVYEALQKLPESPNKFLRRVLSANGVFESKSPSDESSKVTRTVPSAYDSMPKIGYDNFGDGRGWVRRDAKKRRELRPKGDGKR